MLVTSCSGLPTRNPLPADLSYKYSATPAVQKFRFWGDAWPKRSIKDFKTLSDAQLRRKYSAIYGQKHSYLAISGGSSNGAFGAGLLAGWTRSGDRPEFAIVTGISTGALTAPFAFLGSDYDDELKILFTKTNTKNIMLRRGVLSALTGDSLTDTSPLQILIKKYVTDKIIASIAQEHRRGRRLMIGTMNIDAGRSVIWDIGAIAASNFPHKKGLIHGVMQASASVPVAFPPVLISVDINGRRYDEMYVDGGLGKQVFVYPASVDGRLVTSKLKVTGVPKIYVIRNSRLTMQHKEIKRLLVPITSRSIDTLLSNQAKGDINEIYALCERDGFDFNLAFIPSNFTDDSKELFDPYYMNKLYNMGYNLAARGYPWAKNPPKYLAK